MFIGVAVDMFICKHTGMHVCVYIRIYVCQYVCECRFRAVYVASTYVLVDIDACLLSTNALACHV